jgi:hypothetical protein
VKSPPLDATVTAPWGGDVRALAAITREAVASFKRILTRNATDVHRTTRTTGKGLDDRLIWLFDFERMS